MGNVVSIYMWSKPFIQYVLLSARGSIILGIISAIISVFVGCSLRRLAKRSQKTETMINIISVIFCIIPAWFVYRFLGGYVYFAIARNIGRAVVCGILGWRLPYRIGKMDKSSLIGVMCLSAGRNIMLEFLTGLRGWRYLFEEGYTLGSCLQKKYISSTISLFVTQKDFWLVVVCVIMVISLWMIGKYFLYPRNKRELLIDML